MIFPILNKYSLLYLTLNYNFVLFFLEEYPLLFISFGPHRIFPGWKAEEFPVKLQMISRACGSPEDSLRGEHRAMAMKRGGCF